jgi:hypothetical protein
MATPIAVAASVLAVVLVFVLAREIRLRRALEALLKKLIAYWRSHANASEPDARRAAAADDWLRQERR